MPRFYRAAVRGRDQSLSALSPGGRPASLPNEDDDSRYSHSADDRHGKPKDSEMDQAVCRSGRVDSHRGGGKFGAQSLLSRCVRSSIGDPSAIPMNHSAPNLRTEIRRVSSRCSGSYPHFKISVV